MNKNTARIAFIGYIVLLFLLTLIPFRFRPPAIHHLPWPIGPSEFEGIDLGANIFLFIPLGFLLHFLLPKKKPYYSVWKSLLIGGSVSAVIETLQIIIPARFPSFSDLFANTLGSGLGAFIAILFESKNLLFYLAPHKQKFFLASFIFYTTFLFSLSLFSQEPIAVWRDDARILIGNNLEQARAWKGALVSAAIYDKRLSDSQIKQHFQSGPSPSQNTENPILLYRFNGPKENLLQDQSTLSPQLNLELNGPPQEILGDRGMYFTGASFLISKESGTKIYKRINATRQFSVEAWFYPSRQFDHGGRIISFANTRHDLFYLRQSRDEMAFSIEGPGFKKGRLDWENVEAIFAESKYPVHIVGVYQAGELRIYFNGKEVKKNNMANGFFLLSTQLNFERMNFGGHGLLLLLLFSPLGFLLAMISQNRSVRIRILKATLGLFFVALILTIESQQTPSFFTQRIVWVPPVAFLIGFLSTISFSKIS